MIHRNKSDALLRILGFWPGVSHGTRLEWGPIPTTLCSRGRHGCFAFAAMNRLKSTISCPKYGIWYINVYDYPQISWMMVIFHHFPQSIAISIGIFTERVISIFQVLPLGFRGLLTPVGWWNQAPQFSTVIHIQMPRYFGIYHIFSHPKTVSSWWLYVYIYISIYYPIGSHVEIPLVSVWALCLIYARWPSSHWWMIAGAWSCWRRDRVEDVQFKHKSSTLCWGQPVSASDFNFTRVDNKDQHYAGVSIRFFIHCAVDHGGVLYLTVADDITIIWQVNPSWINQGLLIQSWQ